MRRLCCSLVLLVVTCLAPPPTASAALTPESLKSYLQRVGARVESVKGNLYVTSVPVGKGRVEIRLLNDATKQRLGFYAYGFGNVTAAQDQKEVLAYLLRANGDLGVGAFFVDRDQDIGFKFFVNTRDTLSYQTFEIIYLAAANIISEHAPIIMKMTSVSPPAKPPAEPTPRLDDDRPPAEGGAGDP